MPATPLTGIMKGLSNIYHPHVDVRIILLREEVKTMKNCFMNPIEPRVPHHVFP